MYGVSVECGPFPGGWQCFCIVISVCLDLVVALALVVFGFGKLLVEVSQQSSLMLLYAIFSSNPRYWSVPRL